jgi:hypothetical protein
MYKYLKDNSCEESPPVGAGMDVDGMTGGGKGPPGPSTTAVAPAAGGAPHVRQVQTHSDSEQLRILRVI